MQKIIHQYENVHNVFNQIERLYTEVSADILSNSLVKPKYYPEFKTLDSIFQQYIYDYTPNDFLDIHPALNIDLTEDASTIIVCCSGGKDSVAVALLYKQLGYNVLLYHMKGINKVYTDEYEAVIELADYLEIPYYIDKVVLSGTQRFIEHPMKNYIIMNGAIHFAIENKLPLNIAMGNYQDSHLDSSPFDVCAGDCIEMWDAYKDIIKSVLPGLNIMIPLENQKKTWGIIECDTNLMRLSRSCISPQRFRKYWHKRTCDTHKDLHLWEHRCGCCWKCAVEYIRCADLTLQELHIPYYLHCIEILSNTLYKESRISSQSVQDVFSHYFDYDISESIIGDMLKDAVIQGKRIKINKK